MRRYDAILLSLLIPLGLSACGGDDRLSEEEFVEKANAICAEGNEELDRVADELAGGGEQPSDEDLQEFVDTAVANIGGQLDEIEELSPPEDMEADVEDLLETGRSELADLEDAGVDALQSGENPFVESNAKAGDLGLTECAAEGT
ncbi:MAG: hypothetical protein M3271_00250 [Actinomycetota bacterium]|nr:hypothetical protein [Actinomycetota bacterium]